MALQIDSLPPAPQRTDAPAVFVPKADAMIAALQPFVDQTNAVATEAEANAVIAENSASTSAANANFIGEWDTKPDGTPRTGSLNVPASVAHNGSTWQLLSNIADVTADEPGVSAEWQIITPDPQTATNTANIATNAADTATLKKRTPITGVSTVPVGFDYFATANATIAMDDVTSFVGGERFTIVAAIAATASTLTVDGTQSEEIAPRNGDPTDTVFNLTTVGVGFEFIYNAVTGNWEV